MFAPSIKKMPTVVGSAAALALLAACGPNTAQSEESSAPQSVQASRGGDTLPIPLDRTSDNAAGLDDKSKNAAPNVGDCGDLSSDKETRGKFTTGPFRESAYVVSKVVSMPDQCPKDMDQISFYGSEQSGTFYTVCLDIAWQADKCIELDTISTVKDCISAPTQRSKFRLKKIAEDSSDVNVCEGAAAAISHDVRRYVACAEEVK